MGDGANGARPGGAGDLPPPRRLRLCWTKRRKRRFLTRLAETYDMDAACAAAGLDWATICRLRAADPAFAAEWAAVIAAGYDRLEVLLLRRAGAARAADSRAGEDGIDAALARELLKQRAGRKGDAPAMPARPAADPRPRHERIEALMRKLTQPVTPASWPRHRKDRSNEAAHVARMARDAEPAGSG